MRIVFERRRKGGQENLPFWQQRGWQLSAAFVVLAVVGGLLVLVRSDGDAGAQGGQASTPTTVSTQQACPASTGETELPTLAPADLKWMKVGISMVPTAPSAGPGTIDGPVWSCFAHTPLGAVVAVHCILGHMSGAGWRVVAERQLVPGSGWNAFVASRSSVPDADTPGREAATYVGFLVTSYSPLAAEVALLLKQPTGQLVSTSVSTQWSDGDWKVVPRADGSLYTEPDMSVNSDAGFIKWEA